MTIKTKSQNTVKAYEFLAENKDQAFTIKQVAESLGLTTAQVTGGLVSLAKKEIVTRDVADVDGKEYKTFQWASEATFEFEETKAMSDKAVQLMSFLQEKENEDLTAADIADAMGLVAIAVNGVANALVKKGLLNREEVTVEMPDGKEKTVKFLKLTDEGKAYRF